MPPTRRMLLLGGLGALAPVPVSAQPGAIDAVRAYEVASGGQVGFWARNLATGATLGWRAGQRFPLCSTFKMSLAALVLQRVDHGAERLDAAIALTPADVPDWYAPVARANLARGAMSVEEMCRAAVERSDNSCANLLLARMGGPSAVTAFWRAIGDRDSRLDDNEPALNRVAPGSERNTTTPQAMAGTIERLVLGSVLAPASCDRLKSWLLGCSTGLDRLRAGLPPGWVVGDKTGNNGADAAGDVAIAWTGRGVPLAICAYTRGGHPEASALRTVFAGIAREAAHRLC